MQRVHAGPRYVHGQAERCSAAKHKNWEPGAAHGSQSLLSARTAVAVKRSMYTFGNNVGKSQHGMRLSHTSMSRLS